MGRLSEMIAAIRAEGYSDADAQAKLCQDIVLKGIADSPLSRHATIKGGVVMRSLSGNVRRATQDMDIDFLRYSLSDEAIGRFLSEINCVPGIRIEQSGSIEELKQQDYHGKRVYITVRDASGDAIESKIDLGVHKNLHIEQEEFCFDISSLGESVCLLINSKEQMFTEKLRSLLKFGRFSTRYKDIFDLCFLSERVDREALLDCLQSMIFADPGMRENDLAAVIRRTESTLKDKRYLQKLATSDKNWLGLNAEEATTGLTDFLRSLL